MKNNICQICGEKKERIKTHLTKKHKIDIIDYFMQYKNTNLEENVKQCPICKQYFFNRNKDKIYCSNKCYFKSDTAKENAKILKNSIKENGPWNKGFTKENSKSMKIISEKLKEYSGEKNSQYGKKRSKIHIKALQDGVREARKEGKIKVWNKGLKKENDKRIQKSIEIMNKSKTKNSIKKMQKTIQNQYKNGRTPWNKGLTKETSYSVKINSINQGITRRKMIAEGLLGNFFPGYNKSIIPFWKQIDKTFNMKAQYAEKNNGEFKIPNLPFFVDFYSKKYNLIIEFDEEYHHYKNGKETKKHKERLSLIKSTMPETKIINIREKTFNENNFLIKLEKYIKSFQLVKV